VRQKAAAMKIPVKAIQLILLLTIIGCNNRIKKEYFTGEVFYDYSYESSTLDVDSLAAFRAAKGVIRYDRINYQSRFTGKDTLTCYYAASINKCLMQMGISANYDCEDYGVSNDSVLSSRVYPAAGKILEQECDIVELLKKNSLVRYHVSREIKIAPATYKDHKAYNWDVYGEKGKGGLILKTEHVFKHFTLKGIATGIKHGTAGFAALEMEEKKLDSICRSLDNHKTK
jgi:hypothetical protein